MTMKMNEDIRPVTYLKSRTADLLSQINETRRPVIITQNGEARAVLQDPASYEQLITAIGLLKLLTQGEEDVRKGKTISQDDVFTQLGNKLTSLKKSSES
jgi:prevent-host-death family protein